MLECSTRKAKKYLGDVKLLKSSRKDKKYMIQTPDDGKVVVHFGASQYFDHILFILLKV